MSLRTPHEAVGSRIEVGVPLANPLCCRDWKNGGELGVMCITVTIAKIGFPRSKCCSTEALGYYFCTAA